MYTFYGHSFPWSKCARVTCVAHVHVYSFIKKLHHSTGGLRSPIIEFISNDYNNIGHYKIISGLIFLHISCYLSTRFTEEYFTNTNRGYGASVSTVFIKLRKCQFEDVYGPAQQQFQGIITTRPSNDIVIATYMYTHKHVLLFTHT